MREFTTTRRQVIAGMAGLAVAGSGIAAFSTPTAAALIETFTIENDTIATDDGTITGLTVDASGRWQFDGLDTPAESVRVQLDIKEWRDEQSKWGWQQIAYSKQDFPAARAAAGKFDFEGADVLANTTWTAEDFAAPPNDSVNSKDEGETQKRTTVEARLLLTVYSKDDAQGGDHRLATDEKRTSFDVTVYNQPSTGQAGAEGAAHLEGDDQEPGKGGKKNENNNGNNGNNGNSSVTGGGE
ncbi:hypothetical protein ACFQH6_18365 [Halobacteriaceae archaeon GCM10025711]